MTYENKLLLLSLPGILLIGLLCFAAAVPMALWMGLQDAVDSVKGRPNIK